MNIACIIVAFNPNPEQLVQNFSLFLNYVDKLLIWDNTEKSVLNSIILNDKIEVIGDGYNRGIAYAINQGVKLLFQDSNNYTHLMTMDQDSTWVNFLEYKNIIINNNEEDTIYSPNVNNENLITNGFSKVDFCITSGAIFPINVLRKIGAFNEVYSVDCVDYDFCFKAKNNGVKIIKVLNAELIQSYGVTKKHKLLGFKVNIYSADRLYFIVRNHIFLFRDYPKNRNFRLFLMSFKNYFLFKIPKILIIENDKYRKIKYIFKGIYAGLENDRSKSYSDKII